MSNPEPSWPRAWEPLTPRGVAAFAGASLGRLLIIQMLVAALAAASVVFFLETDWFPVVRAAIHALPEEGQIHDSELQWSGGTSVQLAQNHFLGLAVDMFHSGKLGREAHLQVEFSRSDVRLYALPGYEVIEYPPGLNLAFNRKELEPWWGAWEPAFAVGTAAVVWLGLLVSWALLALIYCVPVKVITFLENRDLNWQQSWRLAGAAMMPGSLFLTAGIMAYSLNWMDLIRLGGVAALQFVIGWIYLFVSPLFCPKNIAAKSAKANPFATGEKKKSPPPEKQSNPFAAKKGGTETDSKK